jgi:hypothetical protein
MREAVLATVQSRERMARRLRALGRSRCAGSPVRSLLALDPD